MLEIKTRLEFWRFIQNIEYDIRVTKNKEIWNKHEMIAKYTPCQEVVQIKHMLIKQVDRWFIVNTPYSKISLGLRFRILKMKFKREIDKFLNKYKLLSEYKRSKYGGNT